MKQRIKETPSLYGLENKLDSICVYTHSIKSTDEIFYIGQGTIERAFNFSNRNISWKLKVKDSSNVHVDIIDLDISEERSIEIEKELIIKYKSEAIELTNGNNGGHCIGLKGENNYFYDKHFVRKLNGNYGNKYSKNSLSIPVIQLDLFGNVVKVWYSATEAAEIGGFDSSCISDCCKHKRRIHNKYQWIYKSEYNKDKDYEYTPDGTNMQIYIAFNKDNSIYGIYSSSIELKLDGFNPKNVIQVCKGQKKSHFNKTFASYFRMCKYDKNKYKDIVYDYLYN